jgi:2-methylcitrate dehydratase PrpD
MSMMSLAKEDRAAASVHAAEMLGFLHGLRNLDDPKPLELARWALLDALGCGLLGARQPWGRIIADDVLSDASQGHCTILGQLRTVSASQAALCNGTAMHGFELDDLLSAALIHPGAVIVPAALAAAQAADTSGVQLLRGIVAGYEATERISLALGTEPSNRGFHKTGVVGAVAGAIAAGVAAGLTFEQLQWAAGLACSCASSVKNFAAGGGAGMVKRLHAGHAAESGVRMAGLARRGFTAPVGAIDGKYGLLEAFSGQAAKPELLAQDMGGRWALDDVWVKVYPICGWIQGVVQLLLAMRKEHGIDASMVERVTVATSSFAVRNNSNTDIKDTMEAQYSIPYCVAVALSGDPMDPEEYTPARARQALRGSLCHKVDLVADAQADSVYPRHFACSVTVQLSDGRALSAKAMDAHGTPAHPCTTQERIEKFSTLAQLSGLGVDADAVIARVKDVAGAASIQALASTLKPSH